MAALLDFVHLRRHSMPAHFDIGHIRRPADIDPGLGPRRERRRLSLVAAWHVGLDGRLACTWSAEPDDPA